MNSFVESPLLALFSGLLYLFCSFLVLIRARRSGFIYLMVYSEWFYIVGIGFGSVFLALGVNSDHEIYEGYISQGGLIGDYAFYHIIFFSVGMFCGAFIDKMTGIKRFYESPTKYENNSNNSQVFLYRGIIFLGLVFLLIYTFLVGPVTALSTAAGARGGSTEGLEDASGYFFLKNIAQIGGLSIIFFPFIIDQKGFKFDIFLICFFGIFLYLITGARAAILDTLILSMLIWFSRKRLRVAEKVLWICSLAFFGLLFTLYGKGLSDYFFAASFDGADIASNEIVNFFGKFFGQFVHLIYSIDAGVKYFFENGSTISKALLLAPLGIFPGWLYSYLDLQALSWQHVDSVDNIVCLNTFSYPGAEPCTMPPYYSGVSAYLGPIAFGFVFGFVKFFIYQKISDLWHRLRFQSEKLWLPLLYFILVARLSVLIPNVIGLFSFFALIGVVFYVFRYFLVKSATSYLK